ncbi:uncharacterized protein DS421_6g175320 [Arachis hypogaea]|nr:uncharacterized protein DS421_6g175320 [Arachis hypogaea]
MWWLARDMELDIYAEKSVSDKGRITAIRSDLRPRLAIAIFLSRLVVVVVPPPALVSASCVTRCLSSWEAMGMEEEEEEEEELERNEGIWERGAIGFGYKVKRGILWWVEGIEQWLQWEPCRVFLHARDVEVCDSDTWCRRNIIDYP